MMSQAEAAAYPAPWKRGFALGLLIFAVLLAFVDRQILALLVEPIRADLALSDTLIGWLQGPAFALFYALAALPLGLVVDRTNRRNLIMAGVAVWSVSTAMCGLASDFTGLFLARVGVGLGEACLIPAVFSLIPDLFPPHRRHFAFGVYVTVAILGASIAMTAGAGAITALQAMEARLFGLDEVWRSVFVLVALPGAPLIVLLLFTPEPSRKEVGMEEAGEPVGFAAYMKRRAGLLLLVALGVGAAGAVAQATLAWAPAMLVRIHALGLAEAGWQLGIAIGIASIAGGIAVARLPRLLEKRGIAHPVMKAALGAIILALPFAILLALAEGPGSTILLSALLLGPAFAAYGMMPALVQAIAPNELRGRAVAIVKLIEYLLVAGVVLSIGMLSDGWQDLPRGLQYAVGTMLMVSAVLSALALTAALVRSRRPS